MSESQVEAAVAAAPKRSAGYRTVAAILAALFYVVFLAIGAAGLAGAINAGAKADYTGAGLCLLAAAVVVRQFLTWLVGASDRE